METMETTIILIDGLDLWRRLATIVWDGFKAEHESGLPTARYRYTRGKTREYVNSWIRVTRWLKPAQIRVGLPECRVLVPSTCAKNHANFFRHFFDFDSLKIYFLYKIK